MDKLIDMSNGNYNLYNYDQFKNYTKAETFDKYGLSIKEVKYEYKYDFNNNWIQRDTFEGGQNIWKEKREYNYQTR